MPLFLQRIALTACLSLTAFPSAFAQSAPAYPNHANLLVVRDAQGNEAPVKTTADWAKRRSHILAHLQEVMGPLPGAEKRVPLNPEYGDTIDGDKFTRRKVTITTEPGDRLPMWLAIPKGLNGKKAPAMLCLHQTTRIGKDEPMGLGGKPNLAYAKELAERGYVVVVPDYPSSGPRMYGDYVTDPVKLGYASTSMKAVWNHIRAIDFLESLPEVDASRVGAIGHSLGGHNSIFIGLFDDRIKAVVSSCGFTAFPRYYGGNIAGWSHEGYMPRLKSVYDLDLKKVPFDFPELIGALAPKAFFTNSPTHDSNFDLGGVKSCVESAKQVYALLGVPDAIRAEYPEAEHDFPPAVRLEAYKFLDQKLKTPRN